MSLTEQLIDAIAEGVARRLEGNILQQQRPNRRLLVIDDAAEYLGYTPVAIRHMVAKGQLPAVRNGRTIRFDIGDLDRWVEEHRGNGAR
jgi:excisionase family DNA binding protein